MPATRPLAQLNAFFTSAPTSVFFTRIGSLHVTNASLTRRLLVADAPLRHGRQQPLESSSCGSAADASSPGSLARPRDDCSRRPPARKPLAQLNAFFTNAPTTNVRWRLHVDNVSLTRKLLAELSSCGSAAAASLPGSLARPCGDCSMRPHLPACNTSRNAAHVHCKRRSSVDRRLPREQRPSPMRLPRGTGRPRKQEERQWAALAAAKHEAAARAVEALTLIEESRHHEAVLAAEANDQRCHEVAAWTVESEALTLVRRHEAETWASLFTVSPLANERSCHEAAARATASAKLALAVRPRARHRHRTGQRNIPRAPSCFVEVAPTHPKLLQGGLPTPTSTMLAQAISPCCLVVSSPTPCSAHRLCVDLVMGNHTCNMVCTSLLPY